eukprot:TRINITY_DN390_c0_g1_i1.p1 TRINITY_DN390_c0_g1~~TRINITY_DN390_c0_g1_i1.p1  ORF type:complete len:156 (-),score=61.58 TRINITY_DN390_c0_g1_i1:277-744(-)
MATAGEEIKKEKNEIIEIQTNEQFEQCYPLIIQLRPHLDTLEKFKNQVKLQNQQGYKLFALYNDGKPRTLAGFRLLTMLYSGSMLYIDDLVTDSNHRSSGFGDQLFDWVLNYAKQQNCVTLHLDSGVQRFNAHRFYFRKRMHISSYHFALDLTNH